MHFLSYDMYDHLYDMICPQGLNIYNNSSSPRSQDISGHFYLKRFKICLVLKVGFAQRTQEGPCSDDIGYQNRALANALVRQESHHLIVR